MKEVDYIIVGCGLAGIAFCEQLIEHNKSFVVFDDSSQQSSLVATGLYNPVILKRFTEVWKAKEQLGLVTSFYEQLEEKFQVQLDYKIPIFRRFASVEEQNDWFTASDKPSLVGYLSTQLIKNMNPSVLAPYGFGKVLQTGRVDTDNLILHYKKYLIESNLYSKDSFDYSTLNIKDNDLEYKDITARNIVFAEGFGMLKNPYFKELPLNVAKGEIITIKAPGLKIDYVLKSSIFVVPLGSDLYSVGATYNWEDKTNAITIRAKGELINKLKDLITCDFEVVHQVAGIRPTVKDRRPLVGLHPVHKNLAILNGLGTRGVMLAPYVAKALFNHIENGKPLEIDIDIRRFKIIL